MPLRNHHYWIFDMDGTLTLPIHDFESIRKQLGIDSGDPILEAIENMSAHAAMRARKLLHELELELAHKAQPQPEAESVLQLLVDKGKKLGILTRNDGGITFADADTQAIAGNGNITMTFSYVAGTNNALGVTGRIVVTTGSGDAVTIDNIWITVRS